MGKLWLSTIKRLALGQEISIMLTQIQIQIFWLQILPSYHFLNQLPEPGVLIMKHGL